MDDLYQRIWSNDKSLIVKDLEKISGHDLCYLALFYASQKKITEAQDVLNQIREDKLGHSCSVISETNALIYLFLREFNSASAYALETLKEDSKSIFSYWVLARIALLNKKYSDAIQYYKNILKVSPDSDNTNLNIAEAYALARDFKTAHLYLASVKSSPRKKLYNFFFLFGYLPVRLLWIIIICALLAINPFLFGFVYILATIFLSYVFIKWGYQQGDVMLFRSSLYIQSINSIFFLITSCALLNRQF